MASTTGTMRGQMHGSCRPCVWIFASRPSRSTVFCTTEIDEVGFTATRKTISWPVEMPPSIPPVRLVANPCRVSSSLCSEPDISAALNPAPNSIPLVAPMERIALARSASSLSKTGSPRPAGTPVTRHSTTPPTLSPASLAFVTRSSMAAAAPGSAARSGFRSIVSGANRFPAIPPTARVKAVIVTPRAARIFFAIAPAATRADVSRPEARPLPR